MFVRLSFTIKIFYHNILYGSESESSCSFSEPEESLLLGKMSRASSKVGDDLESNVSHSTIFLPRASMSKKRPKTLYDSISGLLRIGVYRNLVGGKFDSMDDFYINIYDVFV